MKKIEFENLSQQEIEDLAMNLALKYLSYKARTVKEVRTHLIEKEFWKSVIDKTINKLEIYRYIDDKNYAETYIDIKKKQKGYKTLVYELKKKGISEEIINQTLENSSPQIEYIEKLALKFIKNKKNVENLNDKVFRHLASKGFEFDEINEVLRRLKSENRY